MKNASHVRLNHAPPSGADGLTAQLGKGFPRCIPKGKSKSKDPRRQCGTANQKET